MHSFLWNDWRPLCTLQGTLERRIFDKYVDPLDGKIRCRQLETVLLDMHTEAANEADAAEVAAEEDNKIILKNLFA